MKAEADTVEDLNRDKPCTAKTGKSKDLKGAKPSMTGVGKGRDLELSVSAVLACSCLFCANLERLM